MPWEGCRERGSSGRFVINGRSERVRWGAGVPCASSHAMVSATTRGSPPLSRHATCYVGEVVVAC